MTESEPIADPDVARLLSITSPETGREGIIVLAVEGELDMLTTQELVDRLDAALAPPTKGVVLDLSGVQFLGSSALSALLSSAESAQSRGVAFSLVAADHATLHPLEVTGIRTSFVIHESVDDALAAIS